LRGASILSLHGATYHDGRCAVRQRPVNHVSVSGDPSDVGGAPIDIVRMIIEDVFESGRRIDQISRGGMENALRFAGGGVWGCRGVFGGG